MSRQLHTLSWRKQRQESKSKVSYSPSLFFRSKGKKTDWHGIHGEPLDAMRFESIRAAKDFQRKYKDVDNFDIYGMDRFEYAFIADEFKGQIEWDIKNINISFIDIEVSSEYGFPDPYEARAPITAICIRELNGNSVVFYVVIMIVQKMLDTSSVLKKKIYANNF